ncbi:UNVERIFIED_ORG: hypothetical protein J2791_002983 [Burkholderia contaminans]|nr:hypothetical protein [Burkholderia contaminans]
MGAISNLLGELGFEQICAPFVFPRGVGKHENFGRYAKCMPISNGGGELFIRSFGTDFNLIPRCAVRFGMNAVFTMGPGLFDEQEVDCLGLIQWLRPAVLAHRSLCDALDPLCVAFESDTKPFLGSRCLRAAFIPALAELD